MSRAQGRAGATLAIGLLLLVITPCQGTNMTHPLLGKPIRDGYMLRFSKSVCLDLEKISSFMDGHYLFMKIMFLFFAAINLAFFLWQSASQGQTSGKGAENIVIPKNVKKLVLLDEGKTRQRPKPKPKGTSKSRSASTQRSRRAEKPLQVASRKTPATTSTSRGGRSSKNICFALGPFEKYEQAKPIAKKLRELGAETFERKYKKPVSSGYWVYLSPYPSWKEARRQVLNLDAQGMKDIFIMGRGKMKNAVSLGLFRSKTAADRRIARLKKLGIKPKTEVQYSLREEYWVDLNIEARKKQVIKTINAIAKGLTLLELRPRECN